jgi:molybdopterin/thiamine biosynthesis adenylyltransferase
MPEEAVEQPDPMAAFRAAQAQVAVWLTRLGGNPEPIAASELSRYVGRGFAAGWRFPVQFSNGIRRLELLLPIGFPWQPPRVALIDRPPFLTWPHVERDGLLCVASNTLEIDPNDPAGAAAVMVGAASDLVETLIGGAYDSEFRDEFLSYWDYAADAGGAALISLVEPAPPTRTIRLWRGKGFYLLADTDAAIEQWLLNRGGKKPDGFSPEAAALVWVGTPPVPRDYPSSGQALRALADQAGGTADMLLSGLVRACPEKIVAMLGFDTAHGPALAGLVMPAPAAPKHGARDPLTKGFRAGMVPESVLLARYLGGAKLLRRSVERADPSWIHGRDQDPRTTRLRKVRVVLVGCGSLGAPIAIALAQAGVGHLVLVDFDRLRWANIGRHPLGAAHVGQFKAKALAEKLRSDFPHITVDHREVDIDTVARLHRANLDESDLIVSATGSWAADARLDAWHAEIGRRIPIVYTWMEAHACAGHAVLLGSSDSCLRRGFDNTGFPAFQITVWPNGAPERNEPACGAVYQPYGPVELGFVNSLAAELTLETLLGEQTGEVHRIWIGSGKRLRQLGGAWSDGWQVDPAFRDEGGFVHSRAWASMMCVRCGKAQAA